MNRIIFFLFSLLLVFLTAAQIDTVVVEDYTKILITTDNLGNIEPVTDLSAETKVGFFLNGKPPGMIRVCNDEKLLSWVNGRLIFSMEGGCDFIDPNLFYQFTASDTVFVSFSSTSLSRFRCEQVKFEEFQVVKDEEPQPRQARDYFREFTIISISTLLFSFSFLAMTFPSRLSFFLNRTYALKASAYEFVNTGFLARENLTLMTILSMCIAFEMIYIGHQIGASALANVFFLGDHLLIWFVLTLWIVLFFFAKRILIQIIAGLFKMRRLRDWQLFDLINFIGHFAVILLIIILWDFIIKSSNDSWISHYFIYYFLVALILFELWFVIKFVTNSSYQKLLIISYLCATEIIPSVFFIGWFFK